MADKPMVSLTQEQLQQLLAGVLAEANNKMSPYDRLKYTEELYRQQRQEQFKTLVAGEVAAAKARALTCSHSRWPQGHKLAGHACPMGKGEWTTGGQIIGQGREKFAALVCLRGCGMTWLFQPTDSELAFFEDSGMLGWEPPAKERLLAYCSFCSKPYPKLTVEAHEAECPAKFQPSPLKQAAQAPSLAAR